MDVKAKNDRFISEVQHFPAAGSHILPRIHSDLVQFYHMKAVSVTALIHINF